MAEGALHIKWKISIGRPISIDIIDLLTSGSGFLPGLNDRDRIHANYSQADGPTAELKLSEGINIRKDVLAGSI